MNKKLFLGMFAAAGMLLAASCSNDELDVVQSGNEAQVTFSLAAEGGIATRATISDGTGVDKLVYAVYKLDANRTPVLQNVVGSDENSQFVKDDFKSGDNVSITLAKGQTYQVAFWAQDGDCKAYDTDDLTAVGVKYQNEDGTNAVNNDELRDAFFKMVEFEVAGDKTIDVVLKRPFAQINVGVTAKDWEAAVASGIEIEKSAVVIKNAANKINLLTGAVEGNETVVTYVSNAIPDETLYVETDETKDGKEAYNWLSMSYILVADANETDVDNDGTVGDARTTLEGLQFTFYPKNGNAIEFKEGLNSVPVQRNWRTNILGKILTGDIQFNVTVDPAYDGDFIYPDGLAQELEFAATFGGTVTLSDDVPLDATLNVTNDMVLNLNGKTITNKVGNTKTDVIVVKEGATLTINGDGKVEAVGGNDGYAIIAEGKLVINGGTYRSGLDEKQDGNCTVYARGKGEVYIYGGDFSTPKGDDQTFVINKKDADRENTTIKIYGGTFKNFDPANNAAEGANTNFCAEGYISSKVGDNYVVVKEGTTLASTSQDLVAAFAKGGTVVLMNNIVLEEQLKLQAGKEVHLDMNGKKITVSDSSVDPAFYTYKGSNLTIDGNGTVELADPYMSLMFPAGDVVIENGTFTRNVPEGTPVNQVGAFFVGAKVSPWGSSNVTINGGYFDGGYYDSNAADIDEILAGTKVFNETEDDIAKRGKYNDANVVRVAIKNNIQLLLNKSSNNFIVYGGTFVGANPAWGDEGCMLPTTPNYLRPWSYYQGAMLDGQTFNESGIVLPTGYTITKGKLEDDRPTYTVSYKK